MALSSRLTYLICFMFWSRFARAHQNLFAGQRSIEAYGRTPKKSGTWRLTLPAKTSVRSGKSFPAYKKRKKIPVVNFSCGLIEAPKQFAPAFGTHSTTHSM